MKYVYRRHLAALLAALTLAGAVPALADSEPPAESEETQMTEVVRPERRTRRSASVEGNDAAEGDTDAAKPARKSRKKGEADGEADSSAGSEDASDSTARPSRKPAQKPSRKPARKPARKSAADSAAETAETAVV